MMLYLALVKNKEINIVGDREVILTSYQLLEYQTIRILPDYFARGVYVKMCSLNNETLEAVNLSFLGYDEQEIDDQNNFIY